MKDSNQKLQIIDEQIEARARAIRFEHDIREAIATEKPQVNQDHASF